MFKVNNKNTGTTSFYAVIIHILPITTQPTFACLKSTIESLEEGVEYVQN